jgi:CheY-like chemotaxis protein
VVVADNDPDVVELLITDLRAEGHDVVGTAAGGEEALRLCVEHRPDVLVVDFRMPPGPNGIEVARRLRQAAASTAVVLYTNYRRADIRKEAAAVGAPVLLKGKIRALRRAVAAAVPPAGRGPASGDGLGGSGDQR